MIKALNDRHRDLMDIYSSIRSHVKQYVLNWQKAVTRVTTSELTCQYYFGCNYACKVVGQQAQFS